METILRVTKYNPEFRDASGKYLKDEWTSVSDVGRYFDGLLFDWKEYAQTEERYITAVTTLFQVKNVSEVRVTRLEKYDIDTDADSSLKKIFDEIQEADVFNTGALDDLLKLVLREYAWFELESSDKQTKVTFGYDYYMYFHSDEYLKTLKNEISKLGLFAD